MIRVRTTQKRALRQTLGCGIVRLRKQRRYILCGNLILEAVDEIFLRERISGARIVAEQVANRVVVLAVRQPSQTSVRRLRLRDDRRNTGQQIPRLLSFPGHLAIRPFFQERLYTRIGYSSIPLRYNFCSPGMAVRLASPASPIAVSARSKVFRFFSEASAGPAASSIRFALHKLNSSRLLRPARVSSPFERDLSSAKIERFQLRQCSRVASHPRR